MGSTIRVSQPSLKRLRAGRQRIPMVHSNTTVIMLRENQSNEVPQITQLTEKHWIQVALRSTSNTTSHKIIKIIISERQFVCKSLQIKLCKHIFSNFFFKVLILNSSETYGEITDFLEVNILKLMQTVEIKCKGALQKINI